MENEQPNYYKAEPEPIMPEGDRDSNEDDDLSYFLQELMYPEPGCIDTLMNPNPNPNPNPKLGHPEEDGPAVEVVQSNNGGDGLVHDQPSSMESSSSISRSSLGDSPMMVRVISDLEVLGPRLDQVMSLSSSVDTGGDPIEKDHMSKPKRKKPIGWTREEHTAFLQGILGGFNGDWKEMSKIFVNSRSPTQIASHAQKYFKRQQSGNPRRRKSINDITLSNISLQIPEQPTASAETRVSFAVDQQALPSFYNIRQSAPNNSLPHPNPNPNPNPEWVLPVGTDHLIQHPLPAPPPPVEEGRLYMSRQRHEISSSSCIPANVPVLSPLPQRMVLPNYSVNPHEFHACHSAHCIWRGSTIEHNPHHQPQTLTSSSWPLQRHNYRSYGDYYPSSIMPLQQSLRRPDSSNAVNNVDMGPAPQPLPADQDSNNINFYP